MLTCWFHTSGLEGKRWLLVVLSHTIYGNLLGSSRKLIQYLSYATFWCVSRTSTVFKFLSLPLMLIYICSIVETQTSTQERTIIFWNYRGFRL